MCKVDSKAIGKAKQRGMGLGQMGMVPLVGCDTEFPVIAVPTAQLLDAAAA